MYRVHLPSDILYVTPEQLPRFLANIAETRYVSKSGEFLQTTSTHELVTDSSTATLLIKTPVKAAEAEAKQYLGLWKEARDKAEKLQAQLDRAEKRKAAKKRR